MSDDGGGCQWSRRSEACEAEVVAVVEIENGFGDAVLRLCADHLKEANTDRDDVTVRDADAAPPASDDRVPRPPDADECEEPGTWDFRVRVTHFNRERAEAAITGNTLDDLFAYVTVEECLGGIDFDDRGDESDTTKTAGDDADANGTENPHD